MAKNSLVKNVALIAAGYAAYSMALQKSMPLGATAYTLAKGIQNLIHKQTGADSGVPGLPDGSGGTGGTGGGNNGGTSGGCRSLAMTNTQYVGKIGNLFVVVIDGAQVFSSASQSVAEQVYNWKLCPDKYSQPAGTAPNGV